LNYDTLQSPFLIAIHGQYGTGSGAISYLQAIADRRGALIIAPVMPQNSEPNFWLDIWGNTQWAFSFATKWRLTNCIYTTKCEYGFWWPEVMKQIYQHTLTRVNRYSAPMYLTGFSMGGQFTTRYMLIRQAIPDSIPIVNAVSVSPLFYTFATDTLNGVPMYFPCGLLRNFPIYCNGCAGVCDTALNLAYSDTIYNVIPIICNEHVIQYYNENYSVLIGDADTAGNMYGCALTQGVNRYERARNFYNFSTNDAIARGTTLQWRYDSVVGVAHNGYWMYNTKRNITDSSTIAEALLFDTPYHAVPSLAPVASFTADTTIVTLPNAMVQFYNGSINANSYLWDFGDSTTSTAFNILHTYLYADTFTVMLTAISGTGCENKLLKQNYIIVKNGVSVNEINQYSRNLQIYPNPSTGQITIKTSNEAIETIEIFNNIGIKEDEISIKNNISIFNYKAKNSINGLYFIKVKTKENVYAGKVVFR
jgi:PKD repeat protein